MDPATTLNESFIRRRSVISQASGPGLDGREDSDPLPPSSNALLSVLKFRSLLKLKLRARELRRGSGASFAPLPTEDLLNESRPPDYGSVGSLSREPSDGETEKWFLFQDAVAIREICTSSKINLLLLLFPFGIYANIAGWQSSVVFLLNFLAILPLAQLLGEFTEEVALHTNDTIGGLLNATLGNATELIISIFALRKGLLRVVQVSLLGSVLSNELLVTGCCFLFGGLANKEQYFNSRVTTIDSSLLLMAVLGLTIPAAFSTSMKSDCLKQCKVEGIIELSHATAMLLFSLYFLLLFFQLKTHKHLMDAPSVEDESEEPEEEPTMKLGSAIFSLAVITAMVAIASELLVNSIEETSQAWGLSEVFIGLILLPIVGNAAEHVTAITVAVKGKMDLALGVALGSSVQIALCVVPLLCICGWIMGKPLTLDFHVFETVVLVVSVLVVSAAVREGTSTWFEGCMLIISYLIIALAYYYRHEKSGNQFVDLDCICGDECCF